jgi:hypothetical protein
MNRHLLNIVIGCALAGLTSLAQSADTRPAPAAPVAPAVVQQQADDFLKKLEAGEYANEKTLETAIGKLPPQAYDILQAALADSKRDAAARQKLEDAFPTIVRTLAPAQERRNADRKWEAEFHRRAYNTSGQKDAKWDNLVQSAFDLWGTSPPLPWKREHFVARAEAWKKVVDAGCKDPAAVFFYLVAHSYVQLPDGARALILDAVNRVENSAYPALLKARVYLFASMIVRDRPADRNDDRALQMHLFDLVMNEWPDVLKTPALPVQVVSDMAPVLLKQATAQGFKLDRAYSLVLTPLKKVNHPQADLYEGLQLLEQAWDTRGYDIARRVSPDRMQSAVKQAQRAEKLLEEAWRRDATNPLPCIEMMRAALLTSAGLETMEKWYQRAIAADPNSYDARGQKLRYLTPQWGGSYEQMIAFGRECLATQNWSGKIPLALLMVHQTIAQETGAGVKHYKDPAVWKDVQDVLDGMLKFDPNDMVSHNTLANLAALSGRHDIARREFAIIGDKPNLEIFGSMQNYEDLRRASGAAAPAAPVGKAPPPVKVDPVAAAAARATVKAQVLRWVGDRTVAGATKGSVTFATKFADERLAAGDNFRMLFAQDMMKSGKASIVQVVGTQLFTFELSAEQAQLTPEIKPKSIQISFLNAFEGAVTREIKLGKLEPEGKGPWDVNRPFTGKVTCDVKTDLPAGNYQFRLWCEIDGKRMIMLNPLNAPPTKGKTSQPFSFAIPAARAQPIAVFVDIVRLAPGASGVDAKMDTVSDTAAMLIDILAGEKK